MNDTRKTLRRLAMTSKHPKVYEICMNAVKEIRFRLGAMWQARTLHMEIEELRESNAILQRATQKNNHQSNSIKPDNIVWIFGTGRSGSSWLWRMLVSQRECVGWNEPYAGVMFPPLQAATNLREREATIFGDSHRQAWNESLKAMFLRCAASRFPEMDSDSYLIVKEPNGSAGASWLAEAVPESRIIVLARDPRDVVASAIDSVKPGAWRTYSNESQMTLQQLTRKRAETYFQQMSASLEAYEKHDGLKSIVTYEELIEDTLHHMSRLCYELDLPITSNLRNSVEKHSWSNVPENRKGEGKAMRKATPGSWRDDLTEEQVAIIEEITSPLLDKLGYVRAT